MIFITRLMALRNFNVEQDVWRTLNYGTLRTFNIFMSARAMSERYPTLAASVRLFPLCFFVFFVPSRSTPTIFMRPRNLIAPMIKTIRY